MGYSKGTPLWMTEVSAYPWTKMFGMTPLEQTVRFMENLLKFTETYPWGRHEKIIHGGTLVKSRAHKIERAARVRACNYVKFETGQNLPPVLKIVTHCIDISHYALLLSTHDWITMWWDTALGVYKYCPSTTSTVNHASQNNFIFVKFYTEASQLLTPSRFWVHLNGSLSVLRQNQRKH